MYITLVACCVLLNAGVAVHLLAQSQFDPRKKKLFVVAAVASTAFKLVLASRWSDFDLLSYGTVASFVLQGKSFYAHTQYYNYAPAWALIVTGLQQISAVLPALHGQAFHFAIAAFLAVADVTLASLLATKYKYEAGIFYLCCPVAIFLTGLYSQFEDFALLVGLASWLLIRTGNVPWRRVVTAAALLGLSVIIKHVLFLFPIWVLLWPRLGSLWKRLAYGAIAYGMFALSFLPWAIDSASRAGIYEHVFHYRSRFFFSLLHLLAASRDFWHIPAAETSLLTLVWIAALIAAGFMVGRGKSELFPMYLLAMFAVSPALNDYYYAIPMLACAIFFPSFPVWAWISTTLVAYFASPGNVFAFTFSRVYYVAMASSQIIIGVLFIVQKRRADRQDALASPPPEIAGKALALAMGSMAIVFLFILIKAWAFGMTSATWLLPADNG